jgi:hypothetical protein
VCQAFRNGNRLAYLETGGLQYSSGQGAKVRIVIDYQHFGVRAMDRGGMLRTVNGDLSGHIPDIGTLAQDLSGYGQISLERADKHFACGIPH